MAGYYHNIRGILPQMTNNTAPYPLVSTASSTYSTSYYPWNAFRRYIGTDSGYSWNSLDNIPQWLKIYTGESTLPIDAYTICGTNARTNSPRDWTLSGSDNDTDWYIINTQSGIMFEPNEIKIFYLDNNASYKYYKVDVTAIYAGTVAKVGIAEMEFLLATTGAYSHISQEITICMTGDSTPNYCEVTASGTTVSGHEPYKAFNHNIANSWRTETGNTTGWLTFYSTSALNVTSYFITCASGIETNSMPSTWTFEGSNNSIDWIILDTQVNQTTWSGGYFKSYLVDSNINYYNYHRINVSINNGNLDYLSIGEIEFLGKNSFGFFMDYIYGNDASSGLNWDNAWKSITTGVTAERIAPGDKIIVAKSSDPVYTGTYATWTNLSSVVTLSGVLTKTIDNCETVWTPSTNITATADAVDCKQGTKSCKLVMGASFTTGLMAYHTLASTQDFSEYQKISFWWKSSTSSTVANTFKVCLCSDTNGITIADDFIIPENPTGTSPYWAPVIIDKGSTLSSGINSIAIYCLRDIVTPTLYFDNFFACNNLNLTTLISKNSNAYGGTEPWWGIQSIDGTTIILDNDPNCGVNSGAGYYGISKTAPLYYREPIRISNVQDFKISESGAIDNHIEFKGGYNKNTNIQDGDTFFDGINIGTTYGLDYNTKNYIKADRFSFCRFAYAITMDTGTDNEFLGFCLCNNGNYGLNSNGLRNKINIDYIVNSSPSYYMITIGSSSINNSIIIKYIYGGLGINFSGKHCYFEFETMANCKIGGSSIGLLLGTIDECIIKGGDVNDCYTGISMNSDLANTVYIYDVNLFNNTYHLNIQASTGAKLIGKNLTIGSYTGSTWWINGPGYPSTFVALTKCENNVYNNIFLQQYSNLISQEDITHSNLGMAWKLSITNLTYVTIDRPKYQIIGKIKVISGIETTINLWVYRTNTALTVGLAIKRFTLYGLTEDIVDMATADAEIWEQLSISFTPSETAIVEVFLKCYGGNTYSVYFDDLSYTQVNDTYTNTLDTVFQGLPFDLFSSEGVQDMAIKRPLCVYDGELEELRKTDVLLLGVGKSAYESAVENGFLGTEQEWLASLVGPPGTGGGGVINLWE